MDYLALPRQYREAVARNPKWSAKVMPPTQQLSPKSVDIELALRISSSLFANTCPCLIHNLYCSICFPPRDAIRVIPLCIQQ